MRTTLHPRPRALWAAWALSLVPLCAPGAVAGEPAPQTYGQVKKFLAGHTKIVELADEAGGRVLVCPQYQGRVMTSSVRGDEGDSFGFVCFDFIRAGQLDPRFNNYGGEERMWLSPEGGQFSLWFKPGVEQTMGNWYTPKNLNAGDWPVGPGADSSQVAMHCRMRLQNASETEFQIDVRRQVRLLERRDLAELFGEPVAQLVAAKGRWVGYETDNRVTNRGEDWSPARGLVSIWMLGMLNSSPQAVVIVPIRPGDAATLGEPVRADYFNKLGEDRLQVLPQTILFRADARYRAKIGTTKRRATDTLGSIDFARGVLTLVKFSLPEDAAQLPYMNNVWGSRLEQPYDGDVVNSYNDGPNELGTQLGDFYELETLSPARALQTGQTLVHLNRTLHIQADRATLDQIARTVLGIPLDEVAQRMKLP